MTRRRPRLPSLALLLALILPFPAARAGAEGKEAAERFRAVVVSVADGDTVRVRRLDDGRLHILRFKGIDTPETEKHGRRREPGQAFADAAKRLTEATLRGREVEVEWTGKDRYGRLLSVVRVDGEDFNARLVREGLAYAFAIPGETPPPERVAQEAEARAARRGLWGAPWRVRPSLYRKYGSLKRVEGDYRGAAEAMRPAPFPLLALAPAEGPGVLAQDELLRRVARAGVRHLGVAAEYRDPAGRRFHAVPLIDPPPKGFPFDTVALPAGPLAGALGPTPPGRARLDAFLAARGMRGGAAEFRVTWIDPAALGWAGLPPDERLHELLVAPVGSRPLPAEEKSQ